MKKTSPSKQRRPAYGTKPARKAGAEARVPVRTPHDRLAREVEAWESGTRTPAELVDAEDAVPRAAESQPISLRLPKALLALLRGFAEREGIGYQVLIKRWLDDRLRLERERLRAQRRAGDATRPDRRQTERHFAPAFPLVDRRADDGRHYEQREA